MKSAREISADILCEIDEGKMSHASINSALRKYDLIPSDKDLVKLLVSGTLEHLNTIDEIINKYSKKSSDKLKPIIRNVLRMSIYQLTYLKNIPKSAVCNEAVKIIERRKMFGLKGFVNAILRKYASEVDEIKTSENSDLPDYIKEIIEKRVGENAEKVFEAFDKPSKISCRLITSKERTEEIICALESDGINSTPSSLVSNGYYLSGSNDITNLKAYKNGLIQIQGISSIYACEVLAPSKGSLVLDICAAPGGKTIALADMVTDSGRVTSCDLTEIKVQTIKNNAERTGLSNIEAIKRDATILVKEDIEKYDFVLADLPCSGLGTIGHKQEIRYRVDGEKVRGLALLQRKILDNAVRYVKKGGKLLYSTCTITFEENEENAEYIEKLGLKKILERQLLPGIHDVSDGFYVALFEKV